MIINSFKKTVSWGIIASSPFFSTDVFAQLEPIKQAAIVRVLGQSTPYKHQHLIATELKRIGDALEWNMGSVFRLAKTYETALDDVEQKDHLPWLKRMNGLMAHIPLKKTWSVHDYMDVVSGFHHLTQEITTDVIDEIATHQYLQHWHGRDLIKFLTETQQEKPEQILSFFQKMSEGEYFQDLSSDELIASVELYLLQVNKVKHNRKERLKNFDDPDHIMNIMKRMSGINELSLKKRIQLYDSLDESTLEAYELSKRVALISAAFEKNEFKAKYYTKFIKNMLHIPEERLRRIILIMTMEWKGHGRAQSYMKLALLFSHYPQKNVIWSLVHARQLTRGENNVIKLARVILTLKQERSSAAFQLIKKLPKYQTMNIGTMVASLRGLSTFSPSFQENLVNNMQAMNQKKQFQHIMKAIPFLPQSFADLFVGSARCLLSIDNKSFEQVYRNRNHGLLFFIEALENINRFEILYQHWAQRFALGDPYYNKKLARFILDHALELKVPAESPLIKRAIKITKTQMKKEGVIA